MGLLYEFMVAMAPTVGIGHFGINWNLLPQIPGTDAARRVVVSPGDSEGRARNRGSDDGQFFESTGSALTIMDFDEALIYWKKQPEHR